MGRILRLLWLLLRLFVFFFAQVILQKALFYYDDVNLLIPVKIKDPKGIILEYMYM